ncbi:hypothetical protein ABPG75_008552 [Micractinium tetrahymenae]
MSPHTMDRWVRRRRRPGFAQSSLARLPDELLLHTLRLVPQRTRVAVQGFRRDGSGAATLCTRGGVEAACRRLRQLALSLPSTARINLNQFGHTAAAPEAQLRRLLPHLQARKITALRLRSGWGVPTTPMTALLANAVFPGLRSLDLESDCCLRFTSSLALCTRLESFTLRFEEFNAAHLSKDDAELLVCQLCRLPGRLQCLQFVFDEDEDEKFRAGYAQKAMASVERLLQLVSAHVPHALLGLSLGTFFPPAPSSVLWSLPHLRRLSINADSAGKQARFAEHLASPTGTTGLDIRATRAAPSWPGLEALPRLRCLQSCHSLPREAWLCPHLTALRCLDINEATSGSSLGAPSVVACTGLRRLQFDGC